LAYENQYSVVFDDSLDCACVGTDFYEYDIALRSWKGWEKLEGIGEAPANRAGMGLALSSEKMFIFGGYRGSYLNDLVEYDINGSSWKDLSPMSAGVAPSVRANMGFEEWNGKLYLFGGQNVLGMLDSFFVYDIALATWTDLSSPRNGTSPTPRSYMGFTKWNSKFYVFGGFDGIMPSPFPPFTSHLCFVCVRVAMLPPHGSLNLLPFCFPHCKAAREEQRE